MRTVLRMFDALNADIQVAFARRKESRDVLIAAREDAASSGRFFASFHHAGGLHVYSFDKTWGSWSHNESLYDGPDCERIFKSCAPKGLEWSNPMARLVWAASWRDVLGYECAPQAKQFYREEVRLIALFGRRDVVAKALRRVLEATRPHDYTSSPGRIRYLLDAEVVIVDSNGVHHGDPDPCYAVDPDQDIYHDAQRRSPSLELRRFVHSTRRTSVTHPKERKET